MRRHLLKAGSREIGGMLMGEEVGDQQFRILDFSADTNSGTKASFVRNADHHDEALSAFFETTGAEYGRFNYLGEWHSHPSFNVAPSMQDIRAMQNLVDGSGGVDFAVLFICRLRWFWRFESSAHLFVRNHAPSTAEVSHVKRFPNMKV
ncbi:MAG: integrative and conjugative element protein (TIGR02256 family) [Sulfitobacter sp.]|jgi:integrative and conjugative element protein (TIGR02256 family)